MPVSLWPFFTLLMVTESPDFWDQGFLYFFPSQAKGPQAVVILYHQARNNIKQDLCAHLTHNPNNKHTASRRCPGAECSACTSTCVNRNCAGHCCSTLCLFHLSFSRAGPPLWVCTQLQRGALAAALWDAPGSDWHPARVSPWQAPGPSSPSDMWSCSSGSYSYCPACGLVPLEVCEP